MKYREMFSGPVPGMPWGVWREYEADEDSDLIEAAIHNPQLIVERLDGKSWVPASWSELPGSEKARRLERQALIAKHDAARKKVSRRLEAARFAVQAADGKLAAAEMEANVTRTEMAAAEKDAKIAEAEIAALEAKIAELRKTPVAA